MVRELVLDSIRSKTCGAQQLEALFREVFFQRYQTLLRGGAAEPLYQPSEEVYSEKDCQPHLLYYREDYVSSVLHESAHWCLAGDKRRQQLDFGYWYLPDGRDQQQQHLFEQVEVKPQALEWIFSQAAGHGFNISADNLSGECEANDRFMMAVSEQAQQWCAEGLPERGALFARALSNFYGTPDFLKPLHYQAVIDVAEVAQ